MTGKKGRKEGGREEGREGGREGGREREREEEGERGREGGAEEGRREEGRKKGGRRGREEGRKKGEGGIKREGGGKKIGTLWLTIFMSTNFLQNKPKSRFQKFHSMIPEPTKSISAICLLVSLAHWLEAERHD